MVEETIAYPRTAVALPLEERVAAIKQRTTRGLLTYNGGKVHHLGSGFWAVPWSRGGFWQVDMEAESCPCEDYEHFGSKHGIACRHVYAAAIARAKAQKRRRSFITAFFAAGEGE